jgi:hypothetical protein
VVAVLKFDASLLLKIIVDKQGLQVILKRCGRAKFIFEFSRRRMKRFHQIFGLLVLIIFLLTGQYMDLYHHHLREMPDGMRMLYRTRHIYILLTGLVHLGIGTYLILERQLPGRILQFLGSALLVISTMLLLAAFFYEPKLQNLYTPLSHWGIYAVASGTLLHLFSGAGQREYVRHSAED